MNPSRRKPVFLAVALMLGAVLPAAGIMVDTTPDWSVDETSSGQGTCFFKAGDVNGDGYEDIIIGAAEESAGPGEAHVFLGGPGGPSTTPDWSAQGEAVGDNFGFTVSTAGDVNGDGISDVIVGAPNAQEGKGRVYVFLGGVNGLSPAWSWYAEGLGGGGYASWSIMTAGDVDDDGRDEVIVGDVSAGASGHAYVYKAEAGRQTLTLVWDTEGPPGISFLGASVSTAGDVNGDGVGDVIVGAPGSYVNNAAIIYLGSRAGGLSRTPFWVGNKYAGGGSSFGIAVAAVGDVDGDGLDDVLVGDMANYHSYLFRGHASSMSIMESWTVAMPAEGAYGSFVAPAGDFNGDGYRDIVVVGSYAYVYYGSASGFPPAASLSVPLPASGKDYWWSWAMSAGDVNGDGGDDLLVASTFFEYDSGTFAGSIAELHYGESRPGSLGAPRQFRLDGVTRIAAGGTSAESGIILRARIGGGVPGALEVEVREVPIPFSGVATHAGEVTAGGAEASVEVTLPVEKFYHWQARVRLDETTFGDWVAFGRRPDAATEVDFHLRLNEAPAGTAAAQKSAGSGTVIEPGGETHFRDAVRFSVQATDGHNDDVRMEIEVRRKETGLSGVATATSLPMAAGGEIAVVGSFPVGLYLWQWRVVDSFGAAGPWTPGPISSANGASFAATNPAPSGMDAAQTDAGTGAVIAPGGHVPDRAAVRFSVRTADSHDDEVRLEIEVRRKETGLSGVATAASELTAPGGEIALEATLPTGSYVWQWRVVDEYDAGGPWTPGPISSSSGASFSVMAAGSSNPNGCSGSSPAGSCGWLLAGMAALAVLRRR